jgi:predicted deacylase
MSAVQVFEQLQQHAIAHSDDSAIVIPQLKLGQWVAQGDVNFICLDRNTMARSRLNLSVS